MKKLIALLTSTLMFFSLCIPAYATESPSSQDISFENTVTGQLIGDDGTVIPVTGYRRDIPSPTSLSPDTQAVTYDYLVPLSSMSHSDNVSGYDPTRYLYATLTLYYTEYDNAPSEYKLTRVSGSWSDPDPNDGTHVATTADIMAVCYGIGTNNIFRDQKVEGSIRSGSSLYTNFQYSIQGNYGAMGATMSIELSQGSTRHWTLDLECYPIKP